MTMNNEVGMVNGEMKPARCAPQNPMECWSDGVLGFPLTPSLHSGLARNPQVASPKRSDGGSAPTSVASAKEEIRIWRQTQSKPVKVFSNFHRLAKSPAITPIYCVPTGSVHNQWCFPTVADTTVGSQSAIRNPQSAIALDSTWFHLIRLIPLPARPFFTPSNQG
jgi:hypothetical protein